MIKRILGFLGLVVGLSEVHAQAPQAIPFQGAVRNANNVLLANKIITVRFSIHNGYSFGNIVYREWQSSVTNSQGLFIVNVGQGNTDIGQFAAINWSDSTKFMQVEIDTTNTRSVWRDIGTQQMLSVPYALSAKKADSAAIATLALNGSPIGTVTANAGTIIPTGWLLCNGQTVSRATYSSLFAAISTTYGKGDGSTTFNVPDYRGMFLRGVDAGAGNDPDTVSRVAQGTGTALAGGNLGTLQADAFASHNHTSGFGSVILMNRGSQYGTYIQSGSSNTTNTGGNETRPKNVYVNYIIKI